MLRLSIVGIAIIVGIIVHRWHRRRRKMLRLYIVGIIVIRALSSA